ncbi:prepronociceptin [Anolis sagrei]|uniref:prepronociceptin n=1 Tax=Anolis sagrei TaxID=38937 RepID=UPI003522DB2A
MWILLRSSLLFLAFAYALSSDCRKDCLSCHRHLYSHQDDFSLLICVMECEKKLLSRATWDLCHKAISRKPSSWLLGFEGLDDEVTWPFEFWDVASPRGRGTLKRFGDFPRAVEDEKQVMRRPDLEDGPSHSSQPDLLGDLLSDPGVQDLQKRFGGFIGVRKSARKWHNQKRFSEFLKQYLGMSPRSVEYDGLADGDLKEQNEV